MDTKNKNQNNRYLESPYVIRSTSPDGQIPFNLEGSIGGSHIFTKDSFSIKPQGKEIEYNRSNEEKE